MESKHAAFADECRRAKRCVCMGMRVDAGQWRWWCRK